MHSLNIRNFYIFLFEFKPIQPIRQHIQYHSQILHTRQFNTANCRGYPTSIETNSNGSNGLGNSFHSCKQYQNTRNKRNSSLSFYNSLPNKNAFIQALRKQLNEDVNIKPKIGKEEKIKIKSQMEVVKVRFVNIFKINFIRFF